jgi:hypothetical protein
MVQSHDIFESRFYHKYASTLFLIIAFLLSCCLVLTYGFQQLSDAITDTSEIDCGVFVFLGDNFSLVHQ